MVSLAIPHSESRLRLVPFRKPPPDFTSPSADSETTRSAVVVSTKRRLMVANDCTMLPPTLNGPTAALVTSMLNLSMAPITTYWTPSNLPTFAAVVGSTAPVVASPCSLSTRFSLSRSTTLNFEERSWFSENSVSIWLRAAGPSWFEYHWVAAWFSNSQTATRILPWANPCDGRTSSRAQDATADNDVFPLMAHLDAGVRSPLDRARPVCSVVPAADQRRSAALVAIEGMAWLGCAGGPGAVPLGPACARPGSRARLGIHARPVLARAARRSRPARARQAVRRRQPVGRRRRALARHRARSCVRPRREGTRFLPAQRFLLGQDDALPRRRRARDLADADVHPLADRAPGGAAAPAVRPARPSRSDRRPANGIRGGDSVRRRGHGPRPLALLSFHVQNRSAKDRAIRCGSEASDRVRFALPGCVAVATIGAGPVESVVRT